MLQGCGPERLSIFSRWSYNREYTGSPNGLNHFKRKTHELGSNNSGGLGKELKGGRERRWIWAKTHYVKFLSNKSGILKLKKKSL